MNFIKSSYKFSVTVAHPFLFSAWIYLVKLATKCPVMYLKLLPLLCFFVSRSYCMYYICDDVHCG